MKLKFFTTASVFSLVLALAAPVNATVWGDWGNDASSFANGGGSVSTFIDAYKGKTKIKSDVETVSRSDTNPTYGAGQATLDQTATIKGRDRNYLAGAIIMDGETNVGAKVGRRGEYAGTQTAGFVGIYGEAYGDNSGVKGSGLGKSNEESLAVDTPYGGYNSSQAQQLTKAEVSGYASGNDSASVSVGAVAESVASAN